MQKNHVQSGSVQRMRSPFSKYYNKVIFWLDCLLAEPFSLLHFRLKALINKSDVMLFMKGDPNTPRCGFSKQTTAVLADTG